MQNTYKGHTAAKIARHMVADKSQTSTYWVDINSIQHRVTAHRDTVAMTNGTLASTLVLEPIDGPRIVLRWSGKPDSILSATVRR